MKKSDFLDKLEVVNGAIADKDNVAPVFSHFWFTGKELLAYNGSLGISIPLQSKFKGGVPASLINLVKVTDRTQVEFTDNEGSFEIKFGSQPKGKEVQWRKPDKLAMMNQDSIFEMPDFDTKKEFQLADVDTFVKAIKSCLRSVSGSANSPEFLGVTLIAKGTTIKIYSTDNKSMSIEQTTAKKQPPFSRIIIPEAFCKSLVSLSARDPKAEIKMMITDDSAFALIGKEIKVFSNLIGEKEEPCDFEGIIDSVIPAKYTKNTPIPNRFREYIERANVVSGSDEAETIAKVKGGILTLTSTSKALGEVSDRMPIGGGHPDTQLKINCKSLLNDLDTFDRMFIGPRCWIMMNGESMYLVSGV